MKRFRYLLHIVLVSVAFILPLHAAMGRTEFDAQVAAVIAKLNREAVADDESPSRLAGLLQSSYGASIEEMKWAVDQSLSWGERAAFSYIRATTGRSFEEIAGANARRDLWDYTEKSGMNSEKMVHSLEQLLKQVERERNSRIFERLRASRKVTPLPDLGSGFGLFQEALDFRHIDSPNPTKIHSNSGALAKGEK